MSGMRRAIRHGVPSRSGIGIALALGLLAFVSTVLRAMGGMDPDEAARGVAGGIGVFTGLLAANALMTPTSPRATGSSVMCPSRGWSACAGAARPSLRS